MKRKKLLVALTISVLLVVAGLAVNYRTFVAAYITRSALEDTRAIAERRDWNADGLHDAGPELREEYRAWIERDLFDVALLLDHLPARGTSRASLPAWITAALYWECQDHHLRPDPGEQKKVEEWAKLVTVWAEAVCLRSHLKEVLVSVLIDDYEMFQDPGDREAGLAKQFVAGLLFAGESDESTDAVFSRQFRRESWAGKVRGFVAERLDRHFWDAVVGDLHGDRERVRAGALALLYRDPNTERLIVEARRMLSDPSELVRLAAAGTLALRGDASGLVILLWGLRHPQWELRWWAVYAISRLEHKMLTLPLRIAHSREQDEFVQEFIEERVHELERLKR